jgi:hypothetical protein
MKVLLIEKQKTDVPTIVDAPIIRYSKSNECLEVYSYPWHYKVVVEPDEAKRMIDEHIRQVEGGAALLDLRAYPAIGIHSKI